MNFNQQALMKAAGVGVGVGVVVGLVSSVPIISLGCCCLGWLLYVAAGAAYGYFDQQSGGQTDMGTYALGGAIAGGLAGLAWGLTKGLVGLVLTLLGVGVAATAQAFSQLEQAGIDIPPGLATQMAATGGTGVVAIFTSMCWGLIVYAVLGAVGGALFAAMKGSSSSATPAV